MKVAFIRGYLALGSYGIRFMTFTSLRSLTTMSVTRTLHCLVMNWKAYGRKISWRDFSGQAGENQEGLRPVLHLSRPRTEPNISRTEGRSLTGDTPSSVHTVPKPRLQKRATGPGIASPQPRTLLL